MFIFHNILKKLTFQRRPKPGEGRGVYIRRLWSFFGVKNFKFQKKFGLSEK